MCEDQKQPTAALWRAVGMVITALGLGVAYYWLVRSPERQPFFTQWLSTTQPALNDFSGGALPSFLHAFALFVALGFLLRCYRVSRSTQRRWLGLSLISLLFIEAAFGHFNGLDVAVIVLALPLAEIFLASIGRAPEYRRSRWVPAVLLSLFSVMGMASYYDWSPYGECARYDEDGFCVEQVQIAEPIYMPYSELRSAVRFEAARPLDNVGRIYVYQQYLYKPGYRCVSVRC